MNANTESKRHDFHGQVVEEMALFFEQLGTSANLGRLFGFLLTASTPVSLETLAERLGVSKPAVSVQIRRLEQLHYCRRLPRASDRRQYFVLNEDYLVDNLRLRMQAQERWLRRLCELTAPETAQHGDADGAGINSTENPSAVVERLQALIRFQSMMQRHYEKLIQEFRNEGD